MTNTSMIRISLRTAGTLACLAAALFLAACGSQNSTPPQVSIAFTPGFLPPANMAINTGQGIAATVTNGSQNAFVGWSVSCDIAPNCGSFDPGSTPSTVPTTYTAPTAVPMNQMVTVTATSADDPTKSVSATITISSCASCSM